MGIRFAAGQDSIQSGSGPTQRPIQRAPGALFLGVKRPVRQADHSRTSITEVKNGGAVSSLPHTFSCCVT
jgi:hypothetical protein